MEKKLNIILSPQKLRYHRKASDKKQQEIADLIGVERTTYVGYEKRQVLELPFPVAEKIAKCLKVDVSDLEQSPEVGKVEKVEPEPDIPHQHKIVDGENYIVFRRAYDQLEKTSSHHLSVIDVVTRASLNLSEANKVLADSVQEAIRSLTKSGNKKQG